MYFKSFDFICLHFHGKNWTKGTKHMGQIARDLEMRPAIGRTTKETTLVWMQIRIRGST
jgi:hypothetical protein